MGNKTKSKPNTQIICKSCVMSNQRPGSTVEFKSKIKEKKKSYNV